MPSLSTSHRKSGVNSILHLSNDPLILSMPLQVRFGSSSFHTHPGVALFESIHNFSDTSLARYLERLQSAATIEMVLSRLVSGLGSTRCCNILTFSPAERPIEQAHGITRLRDLPSRPSQNLQVESKLRFGSRLSSSRDSPPRPCWFDASTRFGRRRRHNTRAHRRGDWNHGGCLERS